MLVERSRLLGFDIYNLQTGEKVGRVGQDIIDPYKLKIAAVTVEKAGISPAVLLSQDVRECSNQGIVVNDASDIVSPEGMPRLQKVIDYDFKLFKVKVYDDQKNYLGRVVDYTVAPDSFDIMQIIVQPALFSTGHGGRLRIHREQVIEINNNKIIVEAPTKLQRVEASPLNINAHAFDPAVDNPFRKRPEGAN